MERQYVQWGTVVLTIIEKIIMLRRKWMSNLNLRHIIQICASFFGAILDVFSCKVDKMCLKSKQNFSDKLSWSMKNPDFFAEFKYIEKTMRVKYRY